MSGKNRIVVTPLSIARSMFPFSGGFLRSTISFDQGDLLIMDWDVNSKAFLRTPQAGDDFQFFCGISPSTVKNGWLARPYSTPTDAAAPPCEVSGPTFGVIAKMVLKSGDTVYTGDSIDWDSASGNAHSVTNVNGGMSIGFYVGADVAIGDGVKEIEVMICSRFPSSIQLNGEGHF
jgi:hypothetical protein